MRPPRSHRASGLLALLKIAHIHLIRNFKNRREIQKRQILLGKCLLGFFFKVARWGAGSLLICPVERWAVCPSLAAGMLAGHQACGLPAAGVHQEFVRIDTFLPQSKMLWKRSAVLETFCLLHYFTCVTMRTDALPLLCCPFTEQDQSLGHKKQVNK